MTADGDGTSTGLQKSLRERATALAANPTLRALARWVGGMLLALLLIAYGYILVLASPSRSVKYRAFGGLPRLIHRDYVPTVGLAAPECAERRPRWRWTALVGWWLGWFAAVFVAWPLLALPQTVPLSFRLFALVDELVFWPRDRHVPGVVEVPYGVTGATDDRTQGSRQPIAKGLRFQVLQRDGFRCQYCGAGASDDPPARLEVDHRLPVALGGTNDVENLVTSCAACNRGKGARFDTSGAGL